MLSGQCQCLFRALSSSSSSEILRMSVKVIGGIAVSQSSLLRTCCVRTCTPVSTLSSRAVTGTVCKRWYASRAKKVSQIIRLNTENKLLFGSKQNLAPKRNQSPREASKVTSRAQNATAKTKSKSTKQTNDRLEEMYLASDPKGGSGTEPDLWVPEYQSGLEHTALPIDKQEIHSEAFYNESAQDSNMYNDDFAVQYAEQEKGYIHIPKIMPIPNSQLATTPVPKKNDKATSGISLSKETRVQQSVITETNSVTHTQVDFILQYPLFPDHKEDVTDQAQEFCNMVKTFGLRVLPSVNTVLNKTRSDLSNFFLQRWREKMIKELGDVGFRKHQEATIWNGTNLHACVQHFLSGIPAADIQVQDGIRGYWDSISKVLPKVKEVEALETSVSHPWLCYKGTFDCVAKYNDVLCVIDWKTSSKPKPMLSNLYDNPLQVVAYLGAINHSSGFTDQFGVLEKAAVVIAYPNGEEAHIHMLSSAVCQQYWEQWCQRLHQYWNSVVEEKTHK